MEKEEQWRQNGKGECRRLRPPVVLAALWEQMCRIFLPRPSPREVKRGERCDGRWEAGLHRQVMERDVKDKI